MILRLACALAALLLPGWTGAVSIVVPIRPDAAPPQIARQEIETVVRGDAAETTTRIVFRNPNGYDLEGTFLMPIPRDTIVTRLSATIGGREVDAAILEREEARAVYTDIVRRMRDPALMEWVDERTVRMQLFPIPARGEMPVTVEMVQPLARMGDYAAFEFADMRAGSTAPVGETTFALRIESEAPIANVWSPTHEIAVEYAGDRRTATVDAKTFRPGEGRGLSVCYSAETTDAPLAFSVYRPRKDEPGWFLLMARPSDAGDKAEAVPYAATFVFDTSGSMNEDGKIDQARSALVQCLGALRERDRFNIVTFATGVERFAESPMQATNENLAEARKYVAALRAQGGTNIAGALDAALAQDVGDMLHQVVLVTDGRPTVGATEASQMLLALGDRKARVFAFGVGYDVNAPLLDALADETRAVSDYAIPGEDVETKVAGFFEAISAPVATDVELAVDGVRVSDVHPSPIGDLFAGRATLVVGRYEKDGKASIALRGKRGGETFERKLAVEFPESTGESRRHVATLWAGRRIAFLIAEMRRNGETTELRDEAVALSKRHGIPTPWTSFLATDDGEADRRVAAPPPPIYISPNPIDPRPRPIPLPMPGDRRRERPPAATTSSAPTGEAVSFGDIRSTSGAAAVDLSMRNNELKSATNAGDIVSPPRSDSDAVRFVDGRTFRFADGAWREADLPGNLAVERVQYLADAWFALHEDAAEIRPFLEMGERVAFRFGNIVLEIGPAGRTTADEAAAIVRMARE